VGGTDTRLAALLNRGGGHLLGIPVSFGSKGMLTVTVVPV
jgi:hypothetical protein